MKRIILLLGALALVAAACGGSEDAGAGEPAADSTTAQAAITTAAPVAVTTTAAPVEEPAGGIVAGEDADVDAIVSAYTVAFDSESEYPDKEPYIDDPSGLEGTVADYLATGVTMGGVGVVVTEVVINGEEANVTYDLLFNGNPTYPDLPGTAVLTADGWKVPRTIFCALMSSARVGCPAE